MTTTKPVTARPPLRMKLSIARGNLIQAAGIAAGAGLLALAAAMTGPSPVRLAAALAGFLAVYDCSHAIGHYLAGPRRRHQVPVLRDPRHRPPRGLPARVPAADERRPVLVRDHR